MNEDIANAIQDSSAREGAIWLLSNVPGFPPISQAIHILAVAVVMASSVLVHLRVLGLALPSFNASQMIARYLPWTAGALVVNFISGLPLVLARPYRYFLNPVFGWKIGFLVPALLLTVVLFLANRRELGFWEASTGRRWTAKAISAIAILLWIGVVMGGRWIAYSDYIFWPE